jgi:hypothetical protein
MSYCNADLLRVQERKKKCPIASHSHPKEPAGKRMEKIIMQYYGISAFKGCEKMHLIHKLQ